MNLTSQSVRHWWETATIYQIYVRSFADSNGDGIGDLAGLTARFDYLAELGIDAIWLTPCYPSPQHDHGYDVADYFDIEPGYGDLAAFDAMVAEAKRRGIKVLLDIVPNHCSWDHAWFRAAVAAGPGSPERDHFYFRDGTGPDGSSPPNNWRAVFGGPAWTRITEPDGTPGQWYLNTFTPQQPDWNWSSVDVIDHFDRTLRFWFDRGVEGFRVDAVAVAGKTPGLPDAPPVPEGTRETDMALRNPHLNFRPEGHEIWRRWRKLVADYTSEHPERDLFMVAEAYTPKQPDRLLEYQNHEEFHQVFAFDLMLAPWNVADLQASINDTLQALLPEGLCPTWTLNNHDAQRSVTRYGRSDARLSESWTGNNLVYTDAPIDLELGTRRARAIALLLLSVPGCVYLYQGEELGLPEVLDLPAAARQDPIFIRTAGREIGRDGCRVPMPWNVDPAGAHGFSPAGAAAPWMPVPADWGRYAAESQDGDDQSMLELYRRAIAVRRRHPDLQTAPLRWVAVEHPDVLAFERGEMTVLVNTGPDPVELAGLVAGSHRVVLASDPNQSGDTVLGGDAAIWLARVESGADDARVTVA